MSRSMCCSASNPPMLDHRARTLSKYLFRVWHRNSGMYERKYAKHSSTMTDLPEPSLRDSHLFGAGPKRVLALDGGGVRGIISLAFLERIETLFRARSGNSDFHICDHFDLIGGTSTGSFIATGLAFGHSVAHLIELYLTLSRNGFQRRRWLSGILAPKFRTEPFVTAIRRQFGAETLGSEKLLCGLAIVAKRLDTGSVWLFHNNPRGRFFGSEGNDTDAVPNRDLLLANLIRASTAAPTYFAPEFIEVARGIKGAFVDGGVSPHDNPALLLLMLATLSGYGFRWPLGADRLTLVSIGTGSPAQRPLAKSVSRLPAALLAVMALESMMQDCNRLNQALLQWIGTSPTLWPIDSEVGNLAADQVGEKPLLHYLRYDAPLSETWLETNLGLHLTPNELAALDALDRPELAPRLLEIGRRAAENQVFAEHFPAGFDSFDAASETEPR
jgi:uncharacterized protein